MWCRFLSLGVQYFVVISMRPLCNITNWTFDVGFLVPQGSRTRSTSHSFCARYRLRLDSNNTHRLSRGCRAGSAGTFSDTRGGRF